MTAKSQRQFQQPEVSDCPPCRKIGSSRMHVSAASSAGCHVNTELPNKVQKGTDIARNKVNNKLTTSKHTKTSKAVQQRLSVKCTLPSPQPLSAGPRTTHQQIAQGLGYAPMLALTEPPWVLRRWLSLDSGLRPNPGENKGQTKGQTKVLMC